MNSNKGYDQADGLREEVQREAERLPSRSELHAHKHRKSTKTKWKVSFPFVRLMGILFLLIPITILAIHFNGQDSNVLSKLFTPPVKNVEPISMPVTAAAETDQSKEEDIQDTEEEPVKESNDVEDEVTTVSDTDTNNKSSQEETETTTSNETVTESEEESETSTEEVEEEAHQESNVEYIEHLVQENETLYRISMKYYGSREGEQIIIDHNNLTNGQVNVGQTLIIPKNR
ncbi:hypothetical protein FIU87_12325 [Bacillus sp. THAF10]|uniref:LysM peptidoglycan-binding domain-containing protein n=1 Tax=Bacillus sp. THAF10 TaxID=2587848 RepID=UPI0012A98ED8|nr:LysM peptidoglycan-binding domain-containing protein [Bacillus sp. THAF10]QFT89436.1 hypothetical protein FIU87_12325 [Bacillus sp. THAF10]